MRVVRTPDGRVAFDETGRLAGRGAYLCADGSCWRQALEKGTLQRALEVPLPEDIRQRLRDAAPSNGEPAALRIAAVGATIDELNGGEAIGQE